MKNLRKDIMKDIVNNFTKIIRKRKEFLANKKYTSNKNYPTKI
jgi:hypothetical protein